MYVLLLLVRQVYDQSSSKTNTLGSVCGCWDYITEVKNIDSLKRFDDELLTPQLHVLLSTVQGRDENDDIFVFDSGLKLTAKLPITVIH